MKVPDELDWQGYESDLDVSYFHRLVFGKEYLDVVHHFQDGNVTERMDELLFAPKSVFQYYVHTFAAFVMSPEAQGESSPPSSFLRLLEAREERKPGEVQPVLQSLQPCLTFIASHQEYFDAPEEIFGSFKERVDKIYQKASQT